MFAVYCSHCDQSLNQLNNHIADDQQNLRESGVFNDTFDRISRQVGFASLRPEPAAPTTDGDGTYDIGWQSLEQEVNRNG